MEGFALKSASSKPSNISEAHTVKVIQSNDQCKLVAAQNVPEKLPTEEKRDPHCKTVLKIVNLGKGRLNRKMSEDDLDGMRELLLQSMIKKTRETEKPPTQSVRIFRFILYNIHIKSNIIFRVEEWKY